MTTTREPRDARDTRETKNGAAAPASEPILPAAILLDVTRFAAGTFLEVQKRSLDVASRQAAEVARLGHEAVGLYEASIRQTAADGQTLLRRAAEAVEAAIERAPKLS